LSKCYADFRRPPTVAGRLTEYRPNKRLACIGDSPNAVGCHVDCKAFHCPLKKIKPLRVGGLKLYYLPVDEFGKVNANGNVYPSKYARNRVFLNKPFINPYA
jgi:hypothetical protein